MPREIPARYGALLCWLLLFGLGAAWIGRQDYLRQYDAFFQGTSIAQRMLSQKTVQHEAVLATLPPCRIRPRPSLCIPACARRCRSCWGWASCATAPGPAACRRPPAWTPPWRRRARRVVRHAAGGRGALLAGGSVQLEPAAGRAPAAAGRRRPRRAGQPEPVHRPRAAPAGAPGRRRARLDAVAAETAGRRQPALRPAQRTRADARFLALGAMAGLGRRQRAAGRRRRRLASRPRRGPAPTRAGPRGGHGTPGHAGRDGRGHRPRAEPAADRHPGPDPRRRTHAGRRRRTARRARGPAGQRRPGPPRPTSSPACARWCAPARRRARGAGSRGAGEFAALPARAGAGAPGRAPGVAQRRPGERPLGDRVALEQILHNLVQNAVDALAGMRAGAAARG